MKTTEEIKKQILQVQTCLDGLLNKPPQPEDVDRLIKAKRYLVDLQIAIGENWPIIDTDKASEMGLFAVRELEDGLHDDLAKMMMELAYDLGGGD